tara:strand:- start:1507 stop:1632 length:126 start_codon:yes stop_codon:yes gene_type:complete
MIILGHLEKFLMLTDLNIPKSPEKYHKHQNNHALKQSDEHF